MDLERDVSANLNHCRGNKPNRRLRKIRDAAALLSDTNTSLTFSCFSFEINQPLDLRKKA